MKFTEEIYINHDPFMGDRDCDIRCKRVSVVKVRKEHLCLLSDGFNTHNIPIGKLARCESAIVDGFWGSYYVCLDCMDKWLIEDIGILPKED